MPFSPAAGTVGYNATSPDAGRPSDDTDQFGAVAPVQQAAPAPQSEPPVRTGRHAGTSLSEADHMPQLLPGVELAGEYQGSGLAEPTYLVLKPGGQSIQVSRLLY